MGDRERERALVALHEKLPLVAGGIGVCPVVTRPAQRHHVVLPQEPPRPLRPLDDVVGVQRHALRPAVAAAVAVPLQHEQAQLGQFHGLRGDAPDGTAEAKRYAELLAQNPPDFAVLGIGENGHLAFIDPPFCDFKDAEAVKVVQPDEICRNQQVNDGAFASLAEVPKDALSLTIPTLMARPKLFAIAPGPAKREAIKNTVEGPIATSCPASILRTHPNAHLFIDVVSAQFLATLK